MPIYEYRCAECGFEEEYLQKMSEPPLTVCPKCGKPSFQKKLTAAGFQLKGSGWYATDFRGKGKPEAKPEATSGAKGEGKSEGKTEGKSEAKSEAKAEARKPDAPAKGGTAAS